MASLRIPLLSRDSRGNSDEIVLDYSTHQHLSSGSGLDALPRDVLQVMLSYLDGPSISRLSCTSKAVHGAASQPGVWKGAVWREFRVRLSSILTNGGRVTPQRTYRQRVSDLLNHKRQCKERVKQEHENREAQIAEVRMNQCIHFGFYFPFTLFQAWAPLAFLMLTCLRADQYFITSWWVPLFPLATMCWLATVGGLMDLFFSKISWRRFWNYDSWASNPYRDANSCGTYPDRGTIGVIWFYLGFALFGVTVALAAEKLDGRLLWSWVKVFTPFWTGIGMLATAGFWSWDDKPLTASLVFIFCISTWLVPTSVTLVLRADGYTNMKYEFCFIPFWLLALCCAGFLLVATAMMLRGRFSNDDYFIFTGCIIAWIGCVLPTLLLTLQEHGSISIPVSGLLAGALVVLFMFGGVFTVVWVSAFNRYKEDMRYNARPAAVNSSRDPVRMFNLGAVDVL